MRDVRPDAPGWAHRLLQFLEPAITAPVQIRRRIQLTGWLAVVLVGALDAAGSRFLALTAAYLVPVVAVAWTSAFRNALAVAVFASAVQTVAEYHKSAGSAAVLVANGFARLSVYAFVTLVLLLLRLQLDTDRRTARLDALTGVANRRAFVETAARELAGAARTGRALAAALVDIDSLKAINDTYGHQAGDIAIVAVANHLVGAVRTSDVVARLGGDEFAVLLTDTEGHDLSQWQQRLGRSVVCAGGPGVVGFTVGLVSYGVPAAGTGEPPPGVDAMLSEADRAMYEMKRARRTGTAYLSGGPAAPHAEGPHRVSGP
jgi:diguanylate cyclase (GGDEF)-like protein